MTKKNNTLDLALMDVEYNESLKKATLIFLDEAKGEIREIALNKQIYNETTKKYEDDQDKSDKVDATCKEFFDLEFDKLQDAIGEIKTLYIYDEFNSFYEIEILNKFTEDDKGMIVEGIITDIFDDGIGIKIRFEYEGSIYGANMSYSDYIAVRKQWFVNPNKKIKQYAKFENKFLVPFDKKDTLIGTKILVEVSMAFGHIYNDIKALKKKK